MATSIGVLVVSIAMPCGLCFLMLPLNIMLHWYFDVRVPLNIDRSSLMDMRGYHQLSIVVIMLLPVASLSWLSYLLNSPTIPSTIYYRLLKKHLPIQHLPIYPTPRAGFL